MSSQPEYIDTGFPPDFSEQDISIIRAVEPYTMTGTERIYALICAVKYIVGGGIRGDLVECGVWKGGSVMAMALALLQLGASDRNLYLFDTFSGMTPAGEEDVDYLGQPADRAAEESSHAAPREEVEAALKSTGYDVSRVHFIQGPVEETLPVHAPAVIS